MADKNMDFTHLSEDEKINGIKMTNVPQYIREKAYLTDFSETLAQLAEMIIQLGVNLSLDPDEALEWARKLQESVSQSEFDSWVATLLDGGPSLFFETKAALTAKHPNGAPGVALVRETDPAKIYVWNGSAWEDFGDYQGIEIKDGSVTENKIASSAIDYIKRVEIPLTLTNGYVTSSNHGNGEGELVSHTAGSYSQIFSILKGVKIQIHAGGGNTVSILSKWTSNGVYQNQMIVGDGITTDHYYTATDDIEYLRVTTLNATVPSEEMYVAIVSNSMEIVTPLHQKITDLNDEVNSVKNYYTPITFTTSNYFVASPNHSSLTEGTLGANASYRLTNIITFNKGDEIRITASTYTSASVLTKWTDAGNYISTIITGDGVTTEYVYTVVDDVEHLRFSTNTQIVPEMKVELIQPIGTKIAELSGNQSVKVNFKPLTAEVRKPVVNIQFDDATLARDNSVAQKMEAKGWKAGFALLVSQLDTQDKVDSYLTLQSQGHEMLNHTRTQRNMSNPTVSVADVESEILGGFRDLRNFGFNIRGFVSPQSALDLSYFPILKRAHEYAYTVYNGLYDPTTATLLPQNQYNDDPLKLWRMSIESTSFENQKLAIDKLCNEGGMLTIYSHTITADFDALLNYLKTKEDANLLEVKTPSQCFDHFYKVNQTNLRDALS